MRVLVHCDRARVYRVRLPQRLAKEALCSLRVALGREQEVDGLTTAVDRAIQVHPAAFHPNIGLIDSPRPVGHTQIGPEPSLQFRCIGLDPAKDGGVCDGNAAVLQHELEVAVADREHEVPTNCPEDHLGGELPAFEGQIRPKCRQSPSCHVPAWLRSPRPANDATEPVARVFPAAGSQAPPPPARSPTSPSPASACAKCRAGPC